MFSVVIPLYNKEVSIKKTIQSVLDQSFQDFEIIVVNDGSTDKSKEVVEAFTDSRINLIDKENGGVSSARNRGIQEAKYDWVAFLDGDDLWKCNKLETIEGILAKNKSIKWVINGYNLIKGQVATDVLYKEEGQLKDILFDLCNGLKIQTSAVIIKKECFLNNSINFRVGVNNSEDREVWYKMAFLYPSPFYIKEILSSYVIDLGGNSLTTNRSQTNFAFLKMKEHLAKEMQALSISRYKIFISFINKFNKDAIIRFWSNNNTWNSNFDQYFSNNELLVLKKVSRYPVIIKKIIKKIIYGS